MDTYNTLGDMNYRGKRVLLRVDINCPMDKKTLKIINDSRIRAGTAEQEGQVGFHRPFPACGPAL